MQLLFILLLLVVPYLILTLAGRFGERLRTAPATRARTGLSLFFAFTGIGHFVRTEESRRCFRPSFRIASR